MWLLLLLALLHVHLVSNVPCNLYNKLRFTVWISCILCFNRRFTSAVEFFISGRAHEFVARSCFQPACAPCFTGLWGPRMREVAGGKDGKRDGGRIEFDGWAGFGRWMRRRSVSSLCSRPGLWHIFLAVKALGRRAGDCSDLWSQDSQPYTRCLSFHVTQLAAVTGCWPHQWKRNGLVSLYADRY